MDETKHAYRQILNLFREAPDSRPTEADLVAYGIPKTYHRAVLAELRSIRAQFDAGERNEARERALASAAEVADALAEVLEPADHGDPRQLADEALD